MIQLIYAKSGQWKQKDWIDLVNAEPELTKGEMSFSSMMTALHVRCRAPGTLSDVATESIRADALFMACYAAWHSVNYDIEAGIYRRIP